MSNNNFTSAGIRINIDTQEANRNLGDMSTRLERSLKSMELSANSFSDRWGNLTKGIKDTKRIVSGIMISQAFYTVSMAATQATSSLYNFSKSMETAAVSMEYFVKGADKARKSQAFLREMNEFAARTPFNTQNTLALSRYMQAVGVSMGATQSFLKVITDTASATGATEQNLHRVVFGLGQMMTKGRIANEEVRQLANANIPIYQILREELKLTGEQISNIGKYWIDSDKAIVAILRGLEKRYEGAADKISDTVTGMTDTIFDNAKIIGQIATQGAYDKLADKLTVLRDRLDDYREVALKQGSAALLHNVLMDLDSTGELGTRFLLLVGNARQLGQALKGLYITAAPIRKMFGDAIYASISAVNMGMTQLTHAVNSALKALGFFGVTSKQVGSALASLYITYRVASWLSLLGQGAAAAAWGLWQTIDGMRLLLPAAMRANMAITTVTLGLAGMVVYAAAAWGLFSKLNKTWAGMNTAKTDGNVLPDSYMDNLKKYQAEYEAWAAEIDKYREEFNSPFTAIDDGTQDAVDGMNDIKDASKKAAKSVKKDWLAAFDEVYTIPSDVGKEIDKVKPPDFGLSLMAPTFTFPKFEELKIEEPKFNIWESFKDSPLDNSNNDVLSSAWWKGILPWAITLGMVKGLAKPFAQRDANRKGGGGGGTGSSGAAFKSTAENTEALKKLVREIIEKENALAQEIAKLSNTDIDLATREAILDKIEDMSKVLGNNIDTMRTLERALGRTERIQSTILAQANELVELRSIAKNVDKYTQYTVQGTGTDAVAEAFRREAKKVYSEIARQYNNIISTRGPSAELDTLVKGILDTGGVEGRIERLISKVDNVTELLEGNNYVAKAYADDIKDALQLSKDVTKELTQLNISNDAVSEAVKQIDTIGKLLDRELDYTGIESVIEELNHMVATADARRASGTPINMSKTLADLDNNTKKLPKVAADIDNIRSTLGARTGMYDTKQALIDMATKYRVTTVALDRSVDSVFRTLKSIDHYSKNIMLNQLEGRKVLLDLNADVRNAANWFTEDYQQGIKDVLMGITDKVSNMLSTNKKPRGLASTYEEQLIRAVEEMGTKLGIATDKIANTVEAMRTNIAKLPKINTRLEYIKNEVTLANKAKRIAAITPKGDVLTYLENALFSLSDTAKSLSTFDKQVLKLKQTIDNSFGKEAIDKQQQIAEEIQTSRAMFADKLEAYNAVAKNTNKKLGRIAINTDAKNVVDAQGKLIETLGEKITRVKGGTRRGYASPAEYVSEAIKQAGLFDPKRVAASGGDSAGLITGQSGYGVSPFTALADNLIKEVRVLNGIPSQLHSLQSIGNMIFGNVAEVPVLASVVQKLAKDGFKLKSGDIFYDATRGMQAQLDALLYKGNRFVSAIDAKALSNMEKTNKLLSTVATQQGEFYKVSARHFKEVVEFSDDIAYQMAHIAAVMDTQKVMLAILDTVGAKIDGPDLSQVAYLNKAIPEDLAIIKKILTRQAYEQYANAVTFNRIADNVKLVELSIPKWAKELVTETSKMFMQVQEQMSTMAMNTNTTIKELLTPMNTLGEKIGNLTAQRFETGAFNPPKTDSPAVNTLLRDISNDLKSLNESIQDRGASRLDDIIKLIEEGYWNKQPESQVITIDLGKSLLGDAAILRGSGVELKEILNELVEFKSSMEYRGTALTTSLTDMVKQINKIAEDTGDIRLDTVIGKTATGKDKTLKDLLFGTQRTDKNLTGGSVVTDQISSMLSGGAALPINNPNAFANIMQLAGYLQSFGTAANLGDVNVQQIDGTSGIIAQFTRLKDALANILKTLELYNDSGEFVKTVSTGGKYFSAGKATPGYGIGDGKVQYVDELSKYFLNIGGDAGKTVSVSATNVSKALTIAQKAGAVIKVAGDIVNRADLEKAYEQLINDYNIKDPMYGARETLPGPVDWTGKESSTVVGLPQTGVDFALSLVSWFNALGTRSGQANTIRDYAKMSPEEQMFFGKVYIAEDDWRKGSLGGATLGRGKIGKTLPQTILEYKPGMLGGKIKDSEAQAYLQSQLGTGSPFDVVVDYIIRSGDTTSKVAKDFYEKYGEHMDTIIKPAYGMDTSWYSAVDTLLQGAGTEINSMLKQAGYGEVGKASDIGLEMKPFFDSILESIRTDTQDRVRGILEMQSKHDTVNDNPLVGDWSRVVEGADFASVSADLRKQIADTLGVSIVQLNEQFGQIKIDSAIINDEIIGWTQRLPEGMTLDGSKLSTSDVQILASAGIQINGDGTVTFMKPMDSNATGEKRTMTLTVDDVSSRVLQDLNKSGIKLDFGTGKGILDLSDVDTISSKMTSALFKLNTNLKGQVSEDMQKALQGIGTVLDSGYFEITNKAVLNGSMTISQYIASMGTKAEELSPEVRTALESIDQIIAQGSDNTSTAVATWADGVVMKSPLKPGQLTEEIEAGFAAIGITFMEKGDELFMIASGGISDKVSDGLSKIPLDIWNKLNPDVKTALEALGVGMTEVGGFMMVDVNKVMEKGIVDIVELYTQRPDLWDQIPQHLVDTFAEMGIEVEGGILRINTQMMDKMVQVGNSWFQAWNKLPPDVISALDAAGIATTDGLLKVTKAADDAAIGETVDGKIIKPFDELPQELKDRLTGGDKSVEAALRGSKVAIENATSDAFMSMIEAVRASFGEAVGVAETGATDIAAAIEKAMTDSAKLSNISSKKSWNPFDNNSVFKYTPITKGGITTGYKVTYGGRVYTIDGARTEDEARQLFNKKYGMPQFASGGLIETDGVYRAGEFGKIETVLPLENKRSMRLVGSAIASQMSPDIFRPLTQAVGIRDAGVQQTKPRLQEAPVDNTDSVVRKVLEHVLPAIASRGGGSSENDKRPLYVGTLIADDNGLRELNRRMEVIELQEGFRRV